MLNSPNRDGGGRTHLLRRVFSPKLVQRVGSNGTGRYWATSPKSALFYCRTSYLHITLSMPKKATFSLRMASEAFIFHWLNDLRGLWHGPEAPAGPPAAFRPTEQVCRSISQTGGRPGGRTSRCRG